MKTNSENKNSSNSKVKSKLKLSSEQKHTGVFKSQESYGFIEGTDLYVRWENINTALNKDTVEYMILESSSEEGKQRYEAKITNVLERYKIKFVGEIIFKEKDYSLVLLNSSKLNKVVTTPATDLPIGERVKVILKNFALDNLRGEIEKKIGKKGDLDIEIVSVLEDYGVSTEFPKEVIEEVEKIDLDIDKHRQQPQRKSFEHIPFITIDPKNSKDFDDAIAVMRNEDGSYLLYVAIADVWTYLRNNPKLIEEASNRATSIYFLDSVIPMIPEKLSNHLCSLVPGEERCAMVVEIHIEEEGKVHWKQMKINPGIIKSKRRFTYEEVNDFFNKKTNFEEESEEIKTSLEEGFKLYKILEQKRINRGYLAIDSPELKIKLNEKGEVISIYKYQRGDAQIMIENFMILANEGIAKFCTFNNIPAIYRIHERPDPSKIIGFIQEAKKLKFIVPEGDYSRLTQKDISSWFNKNKNNPYIEICNLLILRAMQKAKYSIGNMGHFGLHLNHYLHFTSPIRRYPDTLVHRMLWEYAFEKKPLPENNGDKVYRELNEKSQHCTNREIESTEISRSIESLKIIEFLNTKLNQIFKAKVVSPAKFGGFARIEELNIEGFVKHKMPLQLGSHILVRPIHNTKEFKLIKIL